MCVREDSSNLRGRVQSKVSQIADKLEESVRQTAHPALNFSPRETGCSRDRAVRRSAQSQQCGRVEDSPTLPNTTTHRAALRTSSAALKQSGAEG
ncbi:hypothetical protein SKAU_G00109890 [Synaphobranchus kaupii]|uniref:Uncharacterized protein n=1 Tax=Synaphobranchus kaupii TaxID=118154 RepID=A0A9Q1G094_SYNKA|nr:hypothetical protein SKAU_G00109890 [Synaphobranchus kaupii]